MRPIRAAAAMTILLLAGSLPAAPSPRYVRSIAHVTPPEVTLVDERGEQVPLAAVLESSEPVLLQFIFTTCPSVCPALSATFSAAQEELGAGARLVSISIDPEFDTPARLREYARRFNAGPRWRFLTGSRENVAAVQKAFGAYRPNKMWHEPLTFLRPAAGREWVRLAGPLGAAELVAETRRLR
jgi:protein SCO1/2